MRTYSKIDLSIIRIYANNFQHWFSPCIANKFQRFARFLSTKLRKLLLARVRVKIITVTLKSIDFIETCEGFI